MASPKNSYKLLLLIVVTNVSIQYNTCSDNSFSDTVVLGEMRHFHLTDYDWLLVFFHDDSYLLY